MCCWCVPPYVISAFSFYFFLFFLVLQALDLSPVLLGATLVRVVLSLLSMFVFLCIFLVLVWLRSELG